MGEEYIKRTALNHFGVKNSANMWRTIGGIVWPHYAIVEGDGHAAEYRAAGVRARRFGAEIFVHPDDQAKAELVDRERSRRYHAQFTAKPQES